MDFRTNRTVAGHAGVLRRHAAARGIPDSLASRAERAAAKRFTGMCREPLDDHACRRMSAYFDAVVRRGAFRCADPDSIAFRRRLVAASIEEDLRRGTPSPAHGPSVASMALPLPLGL
jgi:hypothetical protein